MANPDMSPSRSLPEAATVENHLDEQQQKHILAACELIIKILSDTDPEKTLISANPNDKRLRIHEDPDKKKVYFHLDSFISSIKKEGFNYGGELIFISKTNTPHSNLNDMSESQIIAYLETVSIGANKFSITRSLIDPNDKYLVIENANNLIQAKHTKEQRKKEADYTELLDIVFNVLNSHRGKTPTPGDSIYFRSSGRYIVRGSESGKGWKDEGVESLLYTINTEPHTTIFKETMEKAGYQEPFFGSTDDGYYLRSTIEFSWKDDSNQ